MKTQTMKDGRTELVAESGKYITEIGELVEGDATRTYCTRRYLIGEQKPEDYRDAEKSEKEAWEQSLNPMV